MVEKRKYGVPKKRGLTKKTLRKYPHLKKVITRVDSAKSVRHKMLAEFDKARCHYCHRKLRRDTATLDHIFPKSRGGKISAENCVLACKFCNKLKGSMPYDRFKSLVIKMGIDVLELS